MEPQRICFVCCVGRVLGGMGKERSNSEQHKQQRRTKWRKGGQEKGERTRGGQKERVRRREGVEESRAEEGCSEAGVSGGGEGE